MQYLSGEYLQNGLDGDQFKIQIRFSFKLFWVHFDSV